MGPGRFRAQWTELLPLSTVPEVLQLSDALRDDILPELGVRFEDHEGGSSGRDTGSGEGHRVEIAFERKNSGTGPRTLRLLRGEPPVMCGPGGPVVVPSWASLPAPPLLRPDCPAALVLRGHWPPFLMACHVGGSLCHVDRQQVSQLVFRLGGSLGCMKNYWILNTQMNVLFYDSWVLGLERQGLLTAQLPFDLCEQEGGPGFSRGPRGREWCGQRWARPRLTAVGLSGLPTVVKLVDRDTLLREREEKKRVSKTAVT